jgi:hypothetical protein
VKLFTAKIRPENPVGMLGTEVGALFRIRTLRSGLDFFESVFGLQIYVAIRPFREFMHEGGKS